MGRTILAVILGVIAMSICVGAVEWIGHQLYPLPAGLDFKNPETLKGFIAQLPVAALLFVLAGWTLGSLVGGYIAARISRLHKRGAALSIGIAMVLLVIMNMLMIPHPLWISVLGVTLPVPFALLGRKLAGG